MKQKERDKSTLIEQFTDDLETYLQDDECEVIQEAGTVNVYLDLPNTENYNHFVSKVERVFSKTKYDTEDWEIDGDYEGCIEIMYVGE